MILSVSGLDLWRLGWRMMGFLWFWVILDFLFKCDFGFVEFAVWFVCWLLRTVIADFAILGNFVLLLVYDVLMICSVDVVFVA